MAEVKTVQMEKEVGFLIDPEVTHVSIVDRGANQTPFKVVKNDKGGEKRMTAKVVYSIVAPKTVSTEEITKALGEDLTNIVKYDNKTENGEVVRYVQQPIDSFKEDTLSIVDIDKELNIKALCAEPKVESDNIIGKLFKKKAQVILTDEQDLPLEEVVKSMSWEVSDEMYAMFSALDGVISQTNGDVSKKLKAVKDIWSNFYSFLSDALAVSKGEALSITPPKKEIKSEEALENGEMQTETETETKTEKTVEDTIVTKENELIGENEAEAVKVEKTETVETPSVEEVVKVEVEKAVSPIVEALKALTEKLDGTMEDIKKMEQLVPTAPKSQEADPVKVEKAEKAPKDFTGSIFGRRA